MVGGAYGEAHPHQASDQVPAAAMPPPHTPDAGLPAGRRGLPGLAVRRRYPVPVLAVSTAAVMAYSLLGYVNGAALLAPAVALFAVANPVTAPRALAIAAVTLAARADGGGAPGNPFGPTGGGFI